MLRTGFLFADLILGSPKSVVGSSLSKLSDVHDLYKYCSLRSFPDRMYLSNRRRVIGFIPYKPSPYSADELQVFINSLKVHWLLL